jgi:hypothetical protein
MSDQTSVLAPTGPFAFRPQDRSARPGSGGVLGTLLSLIFVGAAVYQVTGLDLGSILALVPTSPLFWGLFVISYLIGPASDWFIFQRLWGIGASAFGALVRKLIYNELLVGYLGEVYFYGWARQNLRLVTTPFGAVKDVAVLSAMAGNVATLVFLAVAFLLARQLLLHDHVTATGWSLAFVIGTSLATMLLRRSLFSLEGTELRMVFAVHLFRILATALFSAVLWHLVLPDVELGWWLILVTIRLLISRLPFVPNKDVVFAGIAVPVVGGEAEISALMALMAGLTLAAHVLVGLGFALADLLSKAKMQ